MAVVTPKLSLKMPWGSGHQGGMGQSRLIQGSEACKVGGDTLKPVQEKGRKVLTLPGLAHCAECFTYIWEEAFAATRT